MIDNFSVIEGYVIPKNLLLKLLNTYSNIGRSDIYLEKLGEVSDLIKKNNLDTDTYYFIELLKKANYSIDITENRLRLLITKDSEPKNQKEKNILGLKRVISLIKNQASGEKFNSSDILMYLNMIFNNKVKFDMTTVKERGLTKGNERMSSRLAFDHVLEKYYTNLQLKTFEPIMLSLIVFLETLMIKPYRLLGDEDVKINKIASYLILYYLMISNKVKSYEITSFFEQIYNLEEEINKNVHTATFNYYESYFKLNDFTLFILDLIDQSYTDLIKIVKNYEYVDDSSKAYSVEKTIYRMDKMFTKEDVRKEHPYVSDTTIMRVFTKLKNEQVIMPLSKGRNAIWILTIDENDPRRLF